MTTDDFQPARDKKIKKRIGSALMLISLPVFFGASAFLVDCFPSTPGCVQSMNEMNGIGAVLDLLGILLFISGFILWRIGRRKATAN